MRAEPASLPAATSDSSRNERYRFPSASALFPSRSTDASVERDDAGVDAASPLLDGGEVEVEFGEMFFMFGASRDIDAFDLAFQSLDERSGPFERAAARLCVRQRSIARVHEPFKLLFEFGDVCERFSARGMGQRGAHGIACCG